MSGDKPALSIMPKYLSEKIIRSLQMKLGVLVFLILNFFTSFGQLSKSDIQLVNNEILFLNESIHGALILHRIYESFNQDINQYVDLPTHELNNYDNKDLPDDIYDDPEKWFYPISPNKLFSEVIGQKKVVSSISVINSVKNIGVKLNEERKTLEKTIATQNLNELKILQEIYKNLEGIVSYYDLLESNITQYERIVTRHMFNNDLPDKQKQVYTALGEIHFDIKKAVRQIGDNNQSGVINILSKIQKERNWLMVCISELASNAEKTKLRIIYEIIDQTVDYIASYLNKPSIPEAYALFGKGYYFQNVLLLTRLNRYGNGYITSLNQFFDKNNWSVIHFIEEPHFLKILYPKTAPKVILSKPIGDITTLEDLRQLNKQPKTTPLPDDGFYKNQKLPEKEKLEVDLPLNIVKTHVLYVDSLSFEIELYDHLIKDGDRVSINVNGEWLFNDISLEKEPQRIKLSIKPNAENYIMIQAMNLGWRPPNTVGVRYRSNGKVENMLLKTDLKTTELIQIKYQSNY